MEKAVFQEFINRFHVGGMVTSAKIDGEECSGPMIPSYILLLAEDYAR